MQQNINIKNKKAGFEYELFDKFIAGIQLTGTEIKSIRGGRVSFVDSYCVFIENELWITGLHISEYLYGTYNNHDPKRNRKLLLNKIELKKIRRKVEEKGFTIVPLRCFINENNLAKIEISIARGKKSYDKREDIKIKDNKREITRDLHK
jgi:SsrA-binding protein